MRLAHGGARRAIRSRSPRVLGAVVAVVLLPGVGLLVRARYGWWHVSGPEYRAAFAEVTGLARPPCASSRR